MTKTRSTRLMLGGATAALAMAMLMPVAAQAQTAFQGVPQVVTPGTAIVQQGPVQDTIFVLAPEAVINWRVNGPPPGNINFLPQGRTGRFVGFNDFVVLNRILPFDATGLQINRLIELNGTITSEIDLTNQNQGIVRGGAVWFYSAGGIFVGPSAVINVGSLVLTSNDINTTGGLFGPGGEIRFAGTAASGAVTVAAGARISATNPINPGSSYVALVAPRVVQGGNIFTDGSTALVGAQAADIRINTGLFDINVTVGTDDPNGVVHTGVTGGPLDASPGNDSRVYMVAVPRNTAIEMLLSGTVGYQTVGVSDNGDAIIISAGRNIENGAVSTQSSGSGVAAGVRMGDLLSFNGVDVVAEGDINVASAATACNTCRIVDVSGNLNLTSETAVRMTAGRGQIIRVTGDMNLRADLDGQGGIVEVTANRGGPGASNTLLNAGRVLVNGNMTLDATGRARIGGATNGAAFGGTATLTADGGLIDVDGITTVDASAFATIDDAFLGEDATGGTATTLARNGGTINSGELNVRANATGGGIYLGFSGVELASIRGGNGTGGTAQVQIESGSNITTTGVFSNFNSLNVSAQGNGSVGIVNDGAGEGGNASVTIADVTSSLVTTGMNVDASGFAGVNTGRQIFVRGIFGADGTGGTARVTASGGLTANGLGITANAFGSIVQANPQFLGGNDPVAGAATGGIAELIINNVAPTIDSVFIAANASGGNATGSSTGVAGNADGGDARLILNGTAQLAPTGGFLEMEARASGGNGQGVSGIGSGGNILISLNSPGTGLVLSDLRLDSTARGGGYLSDQFNTSRGAGGFGGLIDIVNLGSLTVTDDALIDASGQGGDAIFSDGNTGQAGNGQGGTINITNSGTMNFLTELVVTSEGRGGIGNDPGSNGGNGLGGVVNVTLTGGVLNATNRLALYAPGLGGVGLGTSGTGTGGTVLLDVNGAAARVSTAFLQLYAQGTGGGSQPFGPFQTQIDTEDGGDGIGGSVEIRSTGLVDVTGAIELVASGAGGEAVDVSGDPRTPQGGNGTGGNALLTANGGTIRAGTTVLLNAAGIATNGANATGDAQGGDIVVSASNGGTITSGDDMSLFAQGRSITSAARGGSVIVTANSGRIATTAVGGLGITVDGFGEASPASSGGLIRLAAGGSGLIEFGTVRLFASGAFNAANGNAGRIELIDNAAGAGISAASIFASANGAVVTVGNPGSPSGILVRSTDGAISIGSDVFFGATDANFDIDATGTGGLAAGGTVTIFINGAVTGTHTAPGGTTIRGGTGLSITGNSGVNFGARTTLVSDGDAEVLGNADITVSDIQSRGTMLLFSTSTLLLGTATSGEGMRIGARNATIGSATTEGFGDDPTDININVDDTLTLGTLNSADSININAFRLSGATSSSTAIAGGIVVNTTTRADFGSMNGATGVSVTSGDQIVGGSVTSGGGNVTLQSQGGMTIGSVNAGGNALLRSLADSIFAGTVDAVGEAQLQATNSIFADRVASTSNAVVINAGQDAIIQNGQALTTLNITAGAGARLVNGVSGGTTEIRGQTVSVGAAQTTGPGSDILLTATQGVDAQALNAARNITINGASLFSSGVFIAGGQIGVTTIGNADFGSMTGANGVTVNSGGYILGGTARATGVGANVALAAADFLRMTNVRAEQGAVAMNARTALVDNVFGGTAVDVTTTQDQTLTNTQSGGAVTLRSTAGGVSGGTVNAVGNVSLTGVGTVTGTSLTSTGGSITVTGGIVGVGTANAATTLTLTSADSVSLTDGTSGGTMTISGTGVVVQGARTTGAAADIIINASALAAALGTATAGRDIRVQSPGAIQLFGAQNAGRDISLNGGSLIAGGQTSTAARNISVVTSGNAALGTMTAGGLVTANSGGSITGTSVTGTAGPVSLTALGSNSVDTITSGSSVVVSGSSIISSAVQAGTTATLTSAGFVTLGTGSSGGNFRIDGTNINVTSLSATGAGSDILLNGSGTVSLGSLNAADTITVNAGTLAGANSALTAGGQINATITGNAAFGTVAGAGGVTMNAGGSITGNSAASGGSAVSLTAATGATIGTANAATTLTIQTGTGDLVLTSGTSGGTMTLGGRNVTVGGATATGATSDVAITATQAANLGTLNAGQDITINAAGISGTGSALTAARNIGVTSVGNIAFGTAVGGGGISIASSAGTVTGTGVRTTGPGAGISLSGTGGLTVATVQSAGTTSLQATNGAVAVNNLQSVGNIAAVGRSAQLTGSGGLNFALLQATAGNAAVTATTGDIGINIGNASGTLALTTQAGSIQTSTIANGVPGSLSGNAITLTASGNVTLNSTATAATALAIDAVGNAAVNAAATGATMTIRSGNITIGTSGRLGTTGTTTALTLTNTDTSSRTFIGGADVTTGYSLSATEMLRLFGGNITINAPRAVTQGAPSLGSNRPPDVVIGAFTLQGGATTAGNLGANGTLTIDTPGSARVVGAVALEQMSASNRFVLSATEAIEVIAGQGSVRMSNGAALAGTIDLRSDDIAVATSAAITAISGLTDIDLIDDRLGQSDGVTLDEGMLAANAIRMTVRNGIYIQNTGTGTRLADRRGFTAGAGGLTIVSAGPATRIVINGRILDAAGTFATGRDTIPLISIIAGGPVAGVGQFASGSTANGCLIANPASCTEGDQVPPIQDIVDRTGGTGQGDPRFNLLIELRDLEPLPNEPLIDDPVTGTGNDDLWQAECEPAEGGEPCPG